MALVNDHAAAERFGNAGDLHADIAGADDAPGLSAQFMERRIKKIETAGGGIAAVRNVTTVFVKMHDERKGHGDGQLRDAVGRVALDVADGNAVLPAPGNVNVVEAGREDADQLQFFGAFQQLAGEPAFVGQDDVRVADALGDEPGFRRRINDELPEGPERIRRNVIADAFAVKQYDLQHDLPPNIFFPL